MNKTLNKRKSSEGMMEVEISVDGVHVSERRGPLENPSLTSVDGVADRNGQPQLFSAINNSKASPSLRKPASGWVHANPLSHLQIS